MASNPGGGARQEHAKHGVKVQTMIYTPYFTPAQLDTLQARARSNRMPPAKWDQTKMAACSFIAAVGAKLGMPQRTIGSAQLLYQRFHLFYPPSDFAMHEVASASLFTASKLNDTPKRAHELLLTSYALRYPELLVPPAGVEPGQDWIAHAYLADADMDAEVLAHERTRLLMLERLLLQCICFQFEMRAAHILRDAVKLAREWGLPKAAGSWVWRVACDSARTAAPLLYPAQTVAIGCVYAACLLLAQAEPSAPVDACLRRFEQAAPWPAKFQAAPDDAQDVAHALLTLYSAHLPTLVSEGRGALPTCVSYPPPLGLLAYWQCTQQRPDLTVLQIRLQRDQHARPPAGQARAVLRANDTPGPTMYHADLPGQHFIATRYLLE